MLSITILSTLLFFISQSFAGFDASAKSNVAVYCGQNSKGTLAPDATAQKRLSHYCAEENGVDILVIAFVTALNTTAGNVDLNLANQLWKTESPQLPYPAPNTTEVIWTCQGHNKTVLLSSGGDKAHTLSEVGFRDDEDAVAGAIRIWAMFGPPTQAITETTSERPFGNATVNGFDFDFEMEDVDSKAKNLAAFITELKRLATYYFQRGSTVSG
jgi:chitinase